MSNPEIIIVPDRDALARQAATRFVEIAGSAIASRGRFAVALSGGSTPRDLYELLATPEFVTQIDWPRAYLFWGDERAVPPDHPDSNYGATYKALIAHIPIPPNNVHRIPSEKNPDDAAREYIDTLHEYFNWDTDKRRQTPIKKNPLRSSAAISVPTFDLILLGLGADGHTASLFPHTRVLRETQRWVAAEYIEKLKAHRITLTPPIINAARHIFFLVAGADKSETAHQVLRGAYRPDGLPAQLIQPTNGDVVWLMDASAGEKMTAGD